MATMRATLHQYTDQMNEKQLRFMIALFEKLYGRKS